MSNILVKIPGIPGEATISSHAGEIECFSMRHAVELPVMAAAVRVEGTARQGPLALTHAIDKATPGLKRAACSGNTVGEVLISRIQTIEAKDETVERITLENARIVRVEVDTPYDRGTREPRDEPLETFFLEYSHITWEFTEFVDGLKKGTTTTQWSVTAQAA